MCFSPLLEPIGPTEGALYMPWYANSCSSGTQTLANTLYNTPPWKLGAHLESGFQLSEH